MKVLLALKYLNGQFLLCNKFFLKSSESQDQSSTSNPQCQPEFKGM